MYSLQGVHKEKAGQEAGLLYGKKIAMEYGSCLQSSNSVETIPRVQML